MTPFAGHDPDVLGSLANERNGLAWQRTALSWVASGAAVARYFAEGGLLRPSTVIGLIMVVIGAVMWLESARRYRYDAHAIRSNEVVRSPAASIRLLWLVTTSLIAMAIVVEVV